VNHVTNPSCFVSTFVKKKEVTTIIPTLQMAQVVRLLKSRLKSFFMLIIFNLAPHMAIMFLVHSLHLPKVTVETNNRGEFKINITNKSGQNAINIMNEKVIIVQIFQLGTSMRDK
jgi:hypothetical protein